MQLAAEVMPAFVLRLPLVAPAESSSALPIPFPVLLSPRQLLHLPIDASGPVASGPVANHLASTAQSPKTSSNWTSYNLVGLLLRASQVVVLLVPEAVLVLLLLRASQVVVLLVPE